MRGLGCITDGKYVAFSPFQHPLETVLINHTPLSRCGLSPADIKCYNLLSPIDQRWWSSLLKDDGFPEWRWCHINPVATWHPGVPWENGDMGMGAKLEQGEGRKLTPYVIAKVTVWEVRQHTQGERPPGWTLRTLEVWREHKVNHPSSKRSASSRPRAAHLASHFAGSYFCSVTNTAFSCSLHFLYFNK